MAETQFHRRSADWPETAEFDGAVARGGGDCHRLSPAHPVTARWLPVCPTVRHCRPWPPDTRAPTC